MAKSAAKRRAPRPEKAPPPPAPTPFEEPLSLEDALAVRSFMAFVEEQDAREPGVIDAEMEAGATYGDDFAREMEDFEAGRHPLQRLGRR